MANTLLERSRAMLDQIEAMDRLVISELKNNTKTKRDQAIQSGKLHNYLCGSVDRSKDVLKILEDKDGFRKEEIAQMAGVNVFKVFYDKLLGIKQYHRKFPDKQPKLEYDPTTNATEEQLKRLFAPMTEKISSRFSGEESYGKYLDLHQLYVRFMNLKRAKVAAAPADDEDDDDDEEMARPTYRGYLEDFFRFDDQKAMSAGAGALGKGPEFLAYLEAMVASFQSFCVRTDPLLQETLEAEFMKWEENFATQSSASCWASFKGHQGYLDLTPFDSAASLEAQGADRLKGALQALGLKCGGSLTQRAQRLFSVKDLKSLEEINPSFLAGRPKKRRRKNRKSNPSNLPAVDEKAKKAAGALLLGVSRCEFLIGKFVKKLHDTLEVTKRIVEQKQIRTWEELEAEMQEEEEAEHLLNNADDDDEDEDEVVYNPKNIPLGWDGKPIPYWLYKLHGLGIDYPCEICGEHVYKGRRAFDRHFQEWRHAHGMRCLGIPNTKHFHDITLIQDAQNLYKKIKNQIQGEVFNADDDEEFEDSDGNVLSKKTYNDLLRQGLL